MPATAVPVAAILGSLAGHDDLVPFTGPDLVVAAGTAVGLVGLVRLHVPDVDAVVGFRPAVRAHAAGTVSPTEAPAVTGRTKASSGGER